MIYKKTVMGKHLQYSASYSFKSCDA